MTSALKFRPSLTLLEIKTILEHLPNYGEHDPLRRKLEVFTLKAQHGITSPSHLTTGRASLESMLGLSEDNTIDVLLEHYNKNPSVLSAKQLTRVQYHRFQNDMMTPEEEEKYLGTAAPDSY